MSRCLTRRMKQGTDALAQSVSICADISTPVSPMLVHWQRQHFSSSLLFFFLHLWLLSLVTNTRAAGHVQPCAGAFFGVCLSATSDHRVRSPYDEPEIHWDRGLTH